MKKLYLFFLFNGLFKLYAQQFTLIKDINPGSGTSNISYLTNVNNILFFAANDGTNGMELWKSDGTSTGTVLVKDIQVGTGSSSIGYLTNVNGILFFVANNGSNGTELWKSDGTDAGTIMVKDIRSGSMGSNPTGLVSMNGVLYFAADNGLQGTELWKSDGTAAGTIMVKDINPNSASAYPQSLVNVNGTLYFAADNGVKGMELWKSDGTSAGTVLVKDIWAGNSESYPFDLAAIGNTLYFSANNGSAGTELWRSDGTASGTTLVKDIWSGSNDGYPYGMVNVGGTLFFSANNGANGIELWKSDGSASGTSLVKDVWPGTQSGAAGNFEKFVNKLVFTGNDGVNGFKTWQSDGTVAGTQMATGLVDFGGGTLEELKETDWRIFASINEASTGSELWGVNLSVILPLDLIEFKGELVNTDGLLSWKTANEINTLEFIVERSVDGNKYEPVGRVASGKHNGIGAYTFVDKDITALNLSSVYYRLRQVDVDSRFTWSNVVTLTWEGNRKFSLYPNPARGTINLQAGNITPGNICYRILDNAGKTILQASGQVTVNGRISIDINTLAKGVYYLDLSANSTNKIMQFVKQ